MKGHIYIYITLHFLLCDKSTGNESSWISKAGRSKFYMFLHQTSKLLNQTNAWWFCNIIDFSIKNFKDAGKPDFATKAEQWVGDTDIILNFHHFKECLCSRTGTKRRELFFFNWIVWTIKLDADNAHLNFYQMVTFLNNLDFRVWISFRSKKDGIVLKNVPKNPRPIFIGYAPFPIWNYNNCLWMI